VQAVIIPAVPIQQPALRIGFWILTPNKIISETHWYYNGTASLQEALGAGIALAEIRAALLPAKCTLVEVRASYEGIYQDSLCLSKAVMFPGDPAWGGLNVSNDAFSVKLSSRQAYSRILHFGAVPDAVMSSDQLRLDLLPDWRLLLELYLEILTGTGGQPEGIWGNPGVETALIFAPRVRILSVAGDLGDTTVTITTLASHLCQPGDVIRVSRWPLASETWPLNTLWSVGSVTPVTLTVTGFPLVAANFLAGGGGTLRKMVRAWHPYREYRIGSLTSRNRGLVGTLCSWEILEPEYKGLLNPGCYAMGILGYGRTYTTKATIFADDDTEVTLRWFRVPFGTPFLPVPHLWAGKPWRFDRTPPTLGPGELTQTPTRVVKGFPPVTPSQWLGADSWWEKGVPFAAIGGPVQSRPGVCVPPLQGLCATGCESVEQLAIVWSMAPFPPFAGVSPQTLVQQTGCTFTSDATDDVIGCPEGTSRAWLVDLPVRVNGLTSQIITERDPHLYSSCTDCDNM
jgi:hypothetical protein